MKDAQLTLAIGQSGRSPCLWPAPCSTVWHWAHLVLKIFSPAAAFPGGASANDAIADPARTVAGIGLRFPRLEEMDAADSQSFGAAENGDQVRSGMFLFWSAYF